jgi:hypothetical protein
VSDRTIPMLSPKRSLLEHLTGRFESILVTRDGEERQRRYAALAAGNPLPSLEYERTFSDALRHRQAVYTKFIAFMDFYLSCSAGERAVMVNLLEYAYDLARRLDSEERATQ